MKQGLILVSACLVGFNCRYNGGTKINKRLVEMVKNGEAIPVCPELLGGCATPRPPREIIEKNGEIKVVTIGGEDVSEEHRRGARETLKICKLFGIEKAILKSKSPSCGCGKIYDGSHSGKLIEGDGITTRLLKKSGIEIVSDEDLG